MQNKTSEAMSEESTIKKLLQKNINTPHENQPHKIEGIIIGEIIGFNEKNETIVSIDPYHNEPIPSKSIINITKEDIGKKVAIGFENCIKNKPIIMGLMHQPEATNSSLELNIHEMDKKTIIKGENEIELTCGESSIILEANGRITLRGNFITSHAHAGQRIRGGSVQIN